MQPLPPHRAHSSSWSTTGLPSRLRLWGPFWPSCPGIVALVTADNQPHLMAAAVKVSNRGPENATVRVSDRYGLEK
jgi:hypothetical protein